jgi:hypothetical protein
VFYGPTDEEYFSVEGWLKLGVEVQKLIDIFESKGTRGPPSKKTSRTPASTPHQRSWSTISPPVRPLVEYESSPPTPENPFISTSGSKLRSAFVALCERDSDGPFTDASGSKSSTKPATKPSTKPATKPSTKPATKPSTRPATKPATKPATSNLDSDSDVEIVELPPNQIAAKQASKQGSGSGSDSDLEILETAPPYNVAKLFKKPGVVATQLFCSTSITKKQLQNAFRTNRFLWRENTSLWTEFKQERIPAPIDDILYLALPNADLEAAETWFQFETNCILISDSD